MVKILEFAATVSICAIEMTLNFIVNVIFQLLMNHSVLMDLFDYGVLMMKHQPTKEWLRYVGMANGVPFVHIIITTSPAILERQFANNCSIQVHLVSRYMMAIFNTI